MISFTVIKIKKISFTVIYRNTYHDILAYAYLPKKKKRVFKRYEKTKNSKTEYRNVVYLTATLVGQENYATFLVQSNK